MLHGPQDAKLIEGLGNPTTLEIYFIYRNASIYIFISVIISVIVTIIVTCYYCYYYHGVYIYIQSVKI